MLCTSGLTERWGLYRLSYCRYFVYCRQLHHKLQLGGCSSRTRGYHMRMDTPMLLRSTWQEYHQHSWACTCRCLQINAFVPEYWGGEIYHDVDKAFYKTFGAGHVRTGSSLALLNPLSPVWRRILAARWYPRTTAACLSARDIIEVPQAGWWQPCICAPWRT